MEAVDIEQIARGLVREYALPLIVRGVSLAEPGRCTIGFADRYSGAPTIVGVCCDPRVSRHHLRESLKRGLDISD